MVNRTLVGTSSQICRQMVLDIYHLSHVFDAMRDSLSVQRSSILPVVYLSVLVFGRRTFYHTLEVKLTMFTLTLNISLVQRGIISGNLLTHLGFVRSCEVLGTLVASGEHSLIPTRLWSSFYLVLNLFSLLFVRISQLNSLRDLLPTSSVERVDRNCLCVSPFVWATSRLWLVRRAHVHDRIVDACT